MPKPGTANTLTTPFNTGLARIATPNGGLYKPTGFQASNFTGGNQGWNPTAGQPAAASAQNMSIDPKAGTYAKTQSNLPVADKQQNAIATGTVPVVNPNSAFQTNTGNAPQGTPQSQPLAANPTFTGLVGKLGNFQTPASDQANTQAQDAYGKTQGLIGQLKQSRDNEATALQQEGNAAIPMGDITGRQTNIRQLYETQQANLGAQAQAESNLFSPALSAAVSGQGQQESALASGAGLAQPQLAGIGSQQYYNPLNPGQAGGSGTPFTAGQVSGDQALGQQYAQNVSANNQAKAIKTNIQSYLATNPTLNPSQFSDVNSALQFLNGKVSNPQYQTLSNYLQEYINTLAPILGVGGDTTNLKTQIANGFVNAAASGQSVSQVLDGIEQLAQAKLNAQQGGSGSTGGTTGGSTGGTVSAGGYNFKQDASGKWVPA